MSDSDPNFLDTKFKPLAAEEIVTTEVVNEIIHNYFGEDCQVITYLVKLGSERGDNYNSLIYAVEVEFKTQPIRDVAENLHMVVKCIPRNPFRVRMINEARLFEKEVKMYKEILPLFGSVSKDFKSLAKCLHSTCNQETDYIAMEDLKMQGFKMLDRYDWLDFEHAKLAVQELAKFHAFSFVKWNGNGSNLLEEFPFLAEVTWVPLAKVTPTLEYLVNNGFTDLAKLLSENGFQMESTCVMDILPGIFERMDGALSVSKKFPSVILHGDAWSNNILFKYDMEGKLEQTKILDFQLARVGSRILDLSYLLFTSLQIPVLNNNCQEFLRIYFDTFTHYSLKWSSPTTQSVDVVKYNEQELTWELFEEEWREYKYAGLTIALYHLPAMCAKPEHVPDFEAVDYEELMKGIESKETSFVNFLKSEETVKRASNLVRHHLQDCFD